MLNPNHSVILSLNFLIAGPTTCTLDLIYELVYLCNYLIGFSKYNIKIVDLFLFLFFLIFYLWKWLLNKFKKFLFSMAPLNKNFFWLKIN